MTKRNQLGSFELMVSLVLMRLGDSAYGVPICEELEKRKGRDVAVGSVYAALERLKLWQALPNSTEGRHEIDGPAAAGAMASLAPGIQREQ